MNDKALNQLYLKDTAFQDLMQRRIFNVLLIASPYDAFMIEEDGRVEEQLYSEYVSLNLSSPPRVTEVTSVDAAIDVISHKHFDLIIMMPGIDLSETFTGAHRIKKILPATPIVVLTPFSKEVSRRLANEDLSGIDYVFSWLGNVDLLLAIIKLLEDKMNADVDINEVGVQMILVVEDSVRFYSSVLPHIYKFLLKQSRLFSTEALNEHEQMLRMRGRPKVMLARDYNEAVELYERYGKNLLGVISDVSFDINGVKDKQAGIKLARWLRAQDPYVPIIIESSEADNSKYVSEFDGIFIDKNSKKLPVDLGEAISYNFGFGPFLFRDPETGQVIKEIESLRDLQYSIFDIPVESLYYHSSRNDLSRWLYSRAMFPIAEVMKMHRFNTIDQAPAVRQLVFDLIVKYRRMKNRGVVAVFEKKRFDRYSNFARIGQGSLGGKGRGLAFVDSIIKKNPVCDNFEGISISIPRTVVLCTDIFDEFMASNDLYPLALSDVPDQTILKYFLEAELPHRLIDDFYALFEVVDTPLAIRSSSLLEDSHYQPFAGVYSTYMIPKVADKVEMLGMLAKAIKSVYASVFFAESKAYMTATSNVIDQEKMAVIIQEVVGREIPAPDGRDGRYFAPSFSGVGRSLNYYPIGAERTDDGVAQVAIGLGKHIVDGGIALRFSPRHPDKALQTSELSLALRDTQRYFDALEMKDVNCSFQLDDGFNIARLNIQDYAGRPELNFMVSTYDMANGRLTDTNLGEGRRVVTFNNVLKHRAFPLAQAVDFMLTHGQEAMSRPVEIEFAGMIPPSINSESRGHIYWLQIRPIVDRKETVDEQLLATPDSGLILRSDTALGHGAIENIRTIMYVRPENFSSLNNPAIASEIEAQNIRLNNAGEPYLLIGPGRWGSSDPALGIPVKWAQISGARLIVESSLGNYRVEPSQGTHFFQNLTSMGVGYFTIDTSAGHGYYDIDYLNSLPADYESPTLRVVTVAQPLAIGLNGRTGHGVVLKPGYPDNE